MVCHLVALRAAVSRCPRTYSGRNPAARTVGAHRRLSTDGHGRAALAACPGLTCGAESSVHPRMSGRRPVASPRGGRAGKGGCAMAGVLGPGHPCGDDAALLVSELFGNSLRHGGSGAPGETVTVKAGGGVVQVEVTERSGPGVPELRPAGWDAEDGRGLGLAAAWGADGDLVRASLWLTFPPGGPGIYLSCTSRVPGVYLWRT